MIIAAAGCAFVAAAFGQRRGSLADDGASRRLERGFDDAAIGMLMRTPRLHVLRVNTAMCALLGREAEEVVGRSILDFTYAEDVQRHVDWIACRFKGNTEVPLIKRHLRPDGSIVEAQVTPPVIEPHDSEVFCFSHVHDVTEQRRAERQKAMIARLGRRAVESNDVLALMGDAMKMLLEILGTTNCLTTRPLADDQVRLVAAAGESDGSTIPAGQRYTAGMNDACGAITIK